MQTVPLHCKLALAFAALVPLILPRTVVQVEVIILRAARV